jgi:putative endonuclease
MAQDPRRARGRLGEQIAVDHLERRGYLVLARNYRTRYGELDVVAADDSAIVFCEVKTRVAGGRSGPPGPLDAIGADKQRRIRSMAAQWLNDATDRPWRRDMRFDAIGITLSASGRLLALEHLEAAFGCA